MARPVPLILGVDDGPEGSSLYIRRQFDYNGFLWNEGYQVRTDGDTRGVRWMAQAVHDETSAYLGDVPESVIRAIHAIAPSTDVPTSGLSQQGIREDCFTAEAVPVPTNGKPNLFHVLS